MGARRPGVRLAEPFEYERQEVGTDADARVLNDDRNVVRALLEHDGDMALWGCELGGTRQQVPDDLPQSVAIAEHGHGSGRGDQWMVIPLALRW